MQENYLANWIQVCKFSISFNFLLELYRILELRGCFSICDGKALFNSLPLEDYKGGVLVLGGDGRYFNREAAQVCPMERWKKFSEMQLFLLANFAWL